MKLYLVYTLTFKSKEIKNFLIGQLKNFWNALAENCGIHFDVAF